MTKDTSKAKKDDGEAVTAPPKEPVTGAIAGVDIMVLEDAVQELWKKGIYAESGMGCTGPIVRVAEDKIDTALQLLKDADFVS